MLQYGNYTYYVTFMQGADFSCFCESAVCSVVDRINPYFANATQFYSVTFNNNDAY